MLAVRTGWTPDVIAELPARFADACRWALYAAAVAGPDGLPSPEIPPGAPPEVKMAALRRISAAERLRGALYPEGD